VAMGSLIPSSLDQPKLRVHRHGASTLYAVLVYISALASVRLYTLLLCHHAIKLALIY